MNCSYILQLSYFWRHGFSINFFLFVLRIQTSFTFVANYVLLLSTPGSNCVAFHPQKPLTIVLCLVSFFNICFSFFYPFTSRLAFFPFFSINLFSVLVSSPWLSLLFLPSLKQLVLWIFSSSPIFTTLHIFVLPFFFLWLNHYIFLLTVYVCTRPFYTNLLTVNSLIHFFTFSNYSLSVYSSFLYELTSAFSILCREPNCPYFLLQWV